jgi:hypothetical protein
MELVGVGGWTARRLFALGIGATKLGESPVVVVAIDMESTGTNMFGNGVTGGVERNARDDEFGKA